MNNKGMTVVEMIVTFSLTALVVTFLMQLLISVNKLQNSSGVKTMLLTKQANITKAIYKDLEYSDITLVETDNHTFDNANITLSDGSIRKIKIDNGQNKKIIYNNKVYNYPDNTVISNLKVEDVITSSVDLGIPTSFVKISIDIKYPNLKGDYGITVILPHDKSKSVSYKYYEGTSIYYDPINNNICNNYHTDNSIVGYNGTNDTKTTDNQTSCLKWFTFMDEDNDLINLLLDHNTSNNVLWSNGVNSSGPVVALNKLREDTSGWNTTRSDSATYSFNGISYNYNYTGLNARLITANEIAKIVGTDKNIRFNSIKNYQDDVTNIDSQCSWFYFDGSGTNYSTYQQTNATSKGTSAFKWLFTNTNNCEDYGCDRNDTANGYLTFSAVGGSNNNAWVVNNEGKLTISSVTSDIYGIRPVITIDKSDVGLVLQRNYE